MCSVRFQRCLILFCVYILLSSGFLISTSVFGEQEFSGMFIEEVLDQSQENGSYEISIHSHVSVGQGFIPTMRPLTRVEVKVTKPRVTQQGLTLSLREDLYGADLIQKTIPAEDIPFFTNWIMFDISDVNVDVGQTYYLVLRSGTSSEAPYRMKYDYRVEDDIYSAGELFRFFDSSDLWESVGTETEFVDACFRTYSFVPRVDLVCSEFQYANQSAWMNATPGQNLSAYFTVQNRGTPYSSLDWKVVTWPSWGDWTFSKKNDSDLMPEDGADVINIQVSAPNINVPDTYTGKIVVVNIHNENDTEEIVAQLETKSKSKHHSWNLQDSFLYSCFSQFFEKDIWFLRFLFTL